MAKAEGTELLVSAVGVSLVTDILASDTRDVSSSAEPLTVESMLRNTDEI